ncbi:AAA family ATPase [Planctomycetota bacterium]
MIESIHIKNYRCLRNVKVEFGALTALVGANASGKSAVLEALHPGATISNRDVWRHDTTQTLVLETALANGRVNLVEFKQGTRQHSGNHPFGFALLHLDLSVLRHENRLENVRRISGGGQHLTNVFGSLTRKEKDRLASELCRLVPVFADVDTRATGNAGHHQLVFQDCWNADIWYTPHEVSDGTMLVLALLTFQFQEPAINVIAIEEPERGLHPYLLHEVVTFLRDLAHGKVGSRAVQVILATHSAELLDCLRPEEVRFLRRAEKSGNVEVETCPTQQPAWERAFQEYRNSLATAWLSGGLGGVPGGTP